MRCGAVGVVCMVCGVYEGGVYEGEVQGGESVRCVLFVVYEGEAPGEGCMLCGVWCVVCGVYCILWVGHRPDEAKQPCDALCSM